MQKRAYDKNVACGLCGAKRKHQIMPPPKSERAAALQKEWACQPVRCRTCGLEFYSPRLQEKFVLAGFFKTPQAKAAATSMATKGVLFGEPEGSAEKQLAVLASMHGAMYDRLAKQFEALNRRAPQSLFEIGASTGWFLSRARERAAASGGKLEVAGCDPNIYAAEIAGSRFGIEVKGVPFGDYKPTGKQKAHYDIIVDGMLAASYEPLKDLQKMVSMARTGGVIAIRIVVTDNDPEGNSVHPVFNQTHFSRVTLKKAVEKAGLKIVEFDDKSEWTFSYVTVLATPVR